MASVQLDRVAAPRLSSKQLQFLENVANCESPTDRFPDGLPLYANSRFMEFDFDTESRKFAWIRNLTVRGFISTSGPMGCFIRLTDAGRAAIAQAQQPPAPTGAQ